MILRDVVVLHGPELQPHWCREFVVEAGRVSRLTLGDPVKALPKPTWVICPGLWNSHTHMGDACAPDGATGLTLEQGFFRPNGYKYRMLAAQSRETLTGSLKDVLGYMAASGTVGHIDFREQGPYGAQLLREASESTGVRSVILGQFNGVPFNAAQLEANTAELSDADLHELIAMLDIADGFSESTMNDLTEPAWRRIREITTARKKWRAIHCLENEGYRNESLRLTGRGDLIRAIEIYDPHLIIHLTVANAEEIALLVKHQVTAVLNPRANANLGLPLPPIAALLDAGVNLLLGTDNGLLNSPNMFAELDYTYKLTKSQYGDSLQPDPAAILRMATSNLRHAFGGAFPGHLAEGLPADFSVLDFRAPHLCRSQHVVASVVSRVTPADVLATFRDGRMIHALPAFRQVPG